MIEMEEKSCPYCGERLKVVDRIDDMQSIGLYQECEHCKVIFHYVCTSEDDKGEWQAYVYNSVSFQSEDMLLHEEE